MLSVRLGARAIGPGHPVFVIAEAGVNHNGDLGHAKALVDAAAGAGADAVKFQTWITERLVAPDAPMAEYQARNTGVEESQFAMLKRLELGRDEFRALDRYARERGIVFLSTPDEEESADFLESLDVAAFKIGSGELTNLPYLAHVARKKRPMLVSTGMGDLDEVRAAVETIRANGDSPLVLLHCVSNYPTEPGDCNLRAIGTLARAFDVPVGFSDHTLGLAVPLAAVALGACTIEKHLTLDRTLPGPDQRVSATPEEFRALVAGIRDVEAALGDGVKAPRPTELPTRALVRKSLVASRPIPRGATITVDALIALRPAGGIPPGDRTRVVGRRARRDIRQGEAIGWDAIE
jgi:N-acetylneuraminate synthase/N,N'-diacetyllegionaminate synthase